MAEKEKNVDFISNMVEAAGDGAGVVHAVFGGIAERLEPTKERVIAEMKHAAIRKTSSTVRRFLKRP